MTVVDLDISKHVFQVHAVDGEGGVVTGCGGGD
jgi:hypothetical protein